MISYHLSVTLSLSGILRLTYNLGPRNAMTKENEVSIICGQGSN